MVWFIVLIIYCYGSALIAFFGADVSGGAAIAFFIGWITPFLAVQRQYPISVFGQPLGTKVVVRSQWPVYVVLASVSTVFTAVYSRAFLFFAWPLSIGFSILALLIWFVSSEVTLILLRMTDRSAGLPIKF